MEDVEHLFQSTPPSREATDYRLAVIKLFVISIHAPLTGGDIMNVYFRC